LTTADPAPEPSKLRTAGGTKVDAPGRRAPGPMLEDGEVIRTRTIHPQARAVVPPSCIQPRAGRPQSIARRRLPLPPPPRRRCAAAEPRPPRLGRLDRGGRAWRDGGRRPRSDPVSPPPPFPPPPSDTPPPCCGHGPAPVARDARAPRWAGRRRRESVWGRLQG